MKNGRDVVAGEPEGTPSPAPATSASQPAAADGRSGTLSAGTSRVAAAERNTSAQEPRRLRDFHRSQEAPPRKDATTASSRKVTSPPDDDDDAVAPLLWSVLPPPRGGGGGTGCAT